MVTDRVILISPEIALRISVISHIRKCEVPDKPWVLCEVKTSEGNHYASTRTVSDLVNEINLSGE